MCGDIDDSIQFGNIKEEKKDIWQIREFLLHYVAQPDDLEKAEAEDFCTQI